MQGLRLRLRLRFKCTIRLVTTLMPRLRHTFMRSLRLKRVYACAQAYGSAWLRRSHASRLMLG